MTVPPAFERGLPPGSFTFAKGIHQQVLEMLKMHPGLEVSPLLDPGNQPALPRPATRFALNFQYCLERVRWQVTMQRHSLSGWVPDFVFPESTFQPLVPGSGSGVNAQQIAEALRAQSSLASAQRLANVVTLLLNSYAAHHTERVVAVAATESRLQFELDTTDAEGRQVMLCKTGAADTKVLFVVPLPGLDLMPLLTPQSQQQSADIKAQSPSRPDSPPKGGSNNMQSPAAASPKAAAQAAVLAAHVRLKVTYTLASSNASTYASRASGGDSLPQLHLELPPALVSILGKAPSLPGWTSGMCLMEYLPAAAETVQSAVSASAAGRSKRCSLLSEITALAGQPLIADGTGYWTGSWRVEVQTVVCLLHIRMSPDFPQELPRLTLQADGTDEDETRPTVTYTDYGWSPRWTPAEMAKRIFSHLEGTAPQWKAHLQKPVGIAVAPPARSAPPPVLDLL